MCVQVTLSTCSASLWVHVPCYPGYVLRPPPRYMFSITMGSGSASPLVRFQHHPAYLLITTLGTSTKSCWRRVLHYLGYMLRVNLGTCSVLPWVHIQSHPGYVFSVTLNTRSASQQVPAQLDWVRVRCYPWYMTGSGAHYGHVQRDMANVAQHPID